MRLVFLGTPDFAVPSLRALVRAGHGIAAVVTRPDRPRRRQSSPPEPSPVRREAEAGGMPVLAPESIREPACVAKLAELSPDVIVVVAFGQILPGGILDIPPHGCINLHASLLPRHRGAAPIARAIMAGERSTGVTTMRMDAGLDTGDILLQRHCPIGPEETAGELTGRLAALGAELLVETLEIHARGGLHPRKQDAREATRAPSLTRADGIIDWSRAARSIADQARGCHPWPLATTELGGRQVSVHRAAVSPGPDGAAGAHAPPGRVLAADDTIVVQCGAGTRLEIRTIQFPGRKVMQAREAVNGRLVKVGDTLGPATSP